MIARRCYLLPRRDLPSRLTGYPFHDLRRGSSVERLDLRGIEQGFGPQGELTGLNVVCDDKGIVGLLFEDREGPIHAASDVEGTVGCTCDAIVATHALYGVFTTFFDVTVNDRGALESEEEIEVPGLSSWDPGLGLSGSGGGQKYVRSRLFGHGRW